MLRGLVYEHLSVVEYNTSVQAEVKFNHSNNNVNIPINELDFTLLILSMKAGRLPL